MNSPAKYLQGIVGREHKANYLLLVLPYLASLSIIPLYFLMRDFPTVSFHLTFVFTLTAFAFVMSERALDIKPFFGVVSRFIAEEI
jgi:hypothetical protein